MSVEKLGEKYMFIGNDSWIACSSVIVEATSKM